MKPGDEVLVEAWVSEVLSGDRIVFDPERPPVADSDGVAWAGLSFVHPHPGCDPALLPELARREGERCPEPFTDVEDK